MNSSKKYPSCFGVLESVFPREKNGLRNTPESCFACLHKTACLKTSLGGPDGLKIKEEIVERSYKSGRIGFFERWSRKKEISREIRKMKKNKIRRRS
ncbi:MAG TPA: hypothetical protein ENG35_06965 [Desulfobacteraceae bacterium]|nr:hypothetical protein [Desulfobacteraceae bacterium]